MKIAVVGCGALGSFYGAKLCRAGHDTHFLLRSDYETVRQHGVAVRSAEGDFRAFPQCARTAANIGPVDLVLIGLKTTANSILAEILPPLMAEHTAVLTLQNGLGNEEAVARVIGAEKILGGLCFVCLNRTAPGQILHVAHGAIVLGEYNRPSIARTHEIASIFKTAGIAATVTEDLARAHWEKLVWNIPFNGLGVAATAGWDAVSSGRMNPDRMATKCLTTNDLLGDPRWEGLVRALMRETICAARAQGLDVPMEAEEKQLVRTRDMGDYKASTLIDFERGLPLELDSLFLLPLQRAQQAGVDCPRLAALCRVLQELATKAS